MNGFVINVVCYEQVYIECVLFRVAYYEWSGVVCYEQVRFERTP